MSIPIPLGVKLDIVGDLIPESSPKTVVFSLLLITSYYESLNPLAPPAESL